MSVRIRGIYATALTALFAEDPGVVQASPAIDERLAAGPFPVEPARISVRSTTDRQGLAVVGDPEVLADRVERLRGVGLDALAWAEPVGRGAVCSGVMTESVGRGAVVDLGEPATPAEPATLPTVDRTGEGFLPYDATADRIDAGDELLVQVREPRAPWAGERPVLDTAVQVEGGLLTLQRGASGSDGGHPTAGGPTLADVLPTEPRDGWTARWQEDSESAGLDALETALERANRRAADIEETLEGVEDATERPLGPVSPGQATAWVWFGRESRFALDALRRDVCATMHGHHRVKAGGGGASAAVDFLEAVCPSPVGETEAFPFGAVRDQFGPREGDRVGIGHGKPGGHLIDLGPATVTDIQEDGTVTLEREMTGGGTYDGLGVDRRAGDVAETSITEGRWWYPTVYRGADGEHRGTYVNVCTPVEVFPGEIRYVDLHVDVVKRADGTVQRLDDDELDGAAAAGLVPPALAEKARSVASAVEQAL